jgi:phage gpG-like protein
LWYIATVRGKPLAVFDFMEVTKDEWTPLLQRIRDELENPQAILAAVGETVALITRENFGEWGVDRPEAWPALSKKYAKKVKRPYATLFVTGDLYNSIQSLPPTNDSVTVIAADEKASWHQLGEGHNPPRPFFPVTADERLTPYAEAAILAAIEQELERLAL